MDFPGNLSEISWNFPGVSQKFPGNVLVENPENIPGKFPGNFPEFSAHIP